MNDPRYPEFLNIFNQRIREERLGMTDKDGITPVEPREMALTSVFLGDMEDLGLIADSEIVYFEKKLGRANGKLNGFSVSEDGTQLTLITTISSGELDEEQRSMPPSEILKAAKAALHIFISAAKPIHEEMEQSCPERDMFEHIHTTLGNISSIRLLVLVDGATGKLPELDTDKDLPSVTLDVWDIERLFRAASSGMAYESIEIDLVEELGAPLPCLQGPDVNDKHRCYFAIIPGTLLYNLYHIHGPRLLELNVRSFLQARGKVNRGIRDTLQNEPNRFLAYNNGISATVEALELTGDNAPSISKIKGLQIVNGGQTMASIHRAKDRDKFDLTEVYVQAKITCIDTDAVDELVPMISRFSNTQNKVNETDFSANHPFHVAFQQLSERVWAPGEVTRWFYERARGQWEVARNREGTTPARLRAFDARTPRSHKIDKNYLAKSINAWVELPNIVSLGGQKCFVAFMKTLSSMGAGWEPDEEYYRNAIAKIIIFKKAEKIARQIGFSAYRANAVCYTVAMIAYRTAGRIKLNHIWANQDTSDLLEETMSNWMPVIHEELVDSSEGRNVTEWCKKKECWALIQSMDLEFPSGFEDELAEGQPLPNVGRFSERKGAKEKVLSQEERERQAKVMKLGVTEWQELITWMNGCPEYMGFPVQICATILGYAATGWQKVPSPRQTKNLVQYVDAWKQSSSGDDDES